jgi:hypothetical protein
MPVTNRLLERAYALLDEQKYEDAALVLEAVVREEPQNVEAWLLYLQISTSEGELTWLGERISASPVLNSTDKENILSYQQYLLEQMEKMETDTPINHPWWASKWVLLPPVLLIFGLFWWFGRTTMTAAQFVIFGLFVAIAVRIIYDAAVGGKGPVSREVIYSYELPGQQPTLITTPEESNDGELFGFVTEGPIIVVGADHSEE